MNYVIIITGALFGYFFGRALGLVWHRNKSGRHGIPEYGPIPAPPAPVWRSLKAHELVKGRVYRDPVAKVMVRVTKVAIEGSSSALENTARGMYWNTATQCYQSMEITDDQLEERVDRPVLPELPDRERDRTWGKEAKFPEREEKQG